MLEEERISEDEKQVSEQEREKADLEDRWKRALADADNLRKRFAKELAAGQVTERRRVTAAWLPIVDNLELALAHAEDTTPIVTGVRAIRDQAVQLLAALGFPRDDQAGIPFDPMRHEAISVVPGDEAGKEPGTVVEVMRAGYGTGAKQLRPAVVVVAGDREA
jgi:molecular chaperone GrpE